METTSLKHCIFLIAFLFSAGAFAQEKIKFRKVPIEDLQMRVYDQDTTAHAVVLYDRGHLHGNTARFTRHVRLKILKTGGTGYANFQVRTVSRSDIDGVTFNLVNGQIEETPLLRENIFKEEIVEGYNTYKIFFPAVRAGSVIDLTYSFDGVPFQWRFQETIPVKFSELVLEPTTAIVFKKTMFGSHQIQHEGFRWTARNVPAFRDEPFMSHHSNYLTHFKLDIESYKFYGVYWNLSSSWEKVAELLMDYPYFGHVLTNSPFLNEKAQEIKKSKVSSIKKIGAAYNFIQENIRWNGHSTNIATRDFWANFKKNHSGNSAEVNLLLVALLQKSGINAYPAVLSTRENGLLNPASASLSGLNYVVGYIKTDSLELFVDATEPDLIPGILPSRCKNVTAYVIDRSDGGWWADTSTGKGSIRKQFIKIEPKGEDGDFVAEVSNTVEDYGYLEWIKGYNELGDEASYRASVIAKSADMSLTDCKVMVDKNRMRATEVRMATLTGSDVIHDLGGELLINPFYFTDISNPFKFPERNYPIDFIYPRTQSVIVSIRLPSGYSLRKLPEQFSLSPLEGATFAYISSMNNGILTIICTLKIGRQIFTQDEYQALRDFYTEINRKLTDPLQVDKKT